MFNRVNLNNKSINGDSREMWTKETIYFAVGTFFDANFLTSSRYIQILYNMKTNRVNLLFYNYVECFTSLFP